MYLERSGGVGIEVKCLVKTDSPSETPGSASSSTKNTTGSYSIDDVQAFCRWRNIMRSKE